MEARGYRLLEMNMNGFIWSFCFLWLNRHMWCPHSHTHTNTLLKDILFHLSVKGKRTYKCRSSSAPVVCCYFKETILLSAFFWHCVLLINVSTQCMIPTPVCVMRFVKLPYPPPLSFYCLLLADLIVILSPLGFHLPSLSGPRGATRSPRSLLARGQRPFELPSQLRPSVPLLCVPAPRLPGCWRGPIDLLPLARTLSKELPSWLGYHLFGTHLATLASWPSLKCIVQRQNKWTVSKTCQPWCFFPWRMGGRDGTLKQLYPSAAQHPVQNRQKHNKAWHE